MGASMRALCAAFRRAASAESLVFVVAARVAVRGVGARHSVVVAGIVLTRWCGCAIVGVVNMTRWGLRSRVFVGFSPVV